MAGWQSHEASDGDDRDKAGEATATSPLAEDSLPDTIPGTLPNTSSNEPFDANQPSSPFSLHGLQGDADDTELDAESLDPYFLNYMHLGDDDDNLDFTMEDMQLLLSSDDHDGDAAPVASEDPRLLLLKSSLGRMECQVAYRYLLLIYPSF